MNSNQFFGIFVLLTYITTIFWAWWKNKDRDGVV